MTGFLHSTAKMLILLPILTIIILPRQGSSAPVASVALRPLKLRTPSVSSSLSLEEGGGGGENDFISLNSVYSNSPKGSLGDISSSSFGVRSHLNYEDGSTMEEIRYPPPQSSIYQPPPPTSASKKDKDHAPVEMGVNGGGGWRSFSSELESLPAPLPPFSPDLPTPTTHPISLLDQMSTILW